MPPNPIPTGSLQLLVEAGEDGLANPLVVSG